MRPRSVLRKWHISKALTSVRELREILPQLTEEEVLHALELEKQTLQRKHIISQLVNQAVQFYKEHLRGTC